MSRKIFFLPERAKKKEKKTVIPPSFSPNMGDWSVIRPTSPNQGVEVYEIASNESTQKIQLFDGGFFVHIFFFLCTILSKI